MTGIPDRVANAGITHRRLGVVFALLLGLALGAGSHASEAGKKFFFKEVVPKLVENGCQNCHTAGYVRPQVFTYEETLQFLAMGDSPQNSVLIYKLANLRSIAPDRPTHPGNQRCASVETEPCRTIIKWWGVEFGKK